MTVYIYKAWGWLSESLLLSDLTGNSNLDSLTLTVRHKIIRIVANKYDSDPKRAGSLAIKYESDIINYRKKYKLKWKVYRNPGSNCSSSDIIGEMFAGIYNDINASLFCNISRQNGQNP